MKIWLYILNTGINFALKIANGLTIQNLYNDIIQYRKIKAKKSQETDLASPSFCCVQMNLLMTHKNSNER